MIDSSAGSDPAPTALSRPGIVAGLGLRGRATGQEVLALLDACLEQVGLQRRHLTALASLERKGAHPALADAASALGVPVLPLAAAALGADAPNPSGRVAAAIGLPSVAEAAALAFGPLLLEKQRAANVTCALSRYNPGDGADRSSASSAASIVATSSAGP